MFVHLFTHTNEIIMKIMLLALLFPVFCHAQSEKANNSQTVFQDSIPKTSFYLKDRRIVFQKVYTSKLQQEELANQLYTFLSRRKDFRFATINGIADAEFFGQICQHRFDAARFGVVPFFNAPLILNEPIDATVVVQVKDNKYRVTITEMAFRSYGFMPTNDNVQFLEKWFVERDGKKLKASKSNTRLANFLDQDFAEMFDLNKSATASDF